MFCQLEETWLAMALNIPLQSELFDADAAVLAIQDASNSDSGGSVFHSSPEGGLIDAFIHQTQSALRRLMRKFFLPVHQSALRRGLAV